MRRTIAACLAFCLAFCLVSCLALPAQATELKGMYDPAKLLETFALIGPARLSTDKTGTVQKIIGQVQAEDGAMIPYEAIFMMCDDTKHACANVHMRHDWYAEKADVWCAINTWKAMPDYKNRAYAAFAFDKVRVIREQFGFVGATVEPEWKFVQFWRKELQSFHAVTQDLPNDCG
ncbi:MAG: hypothetical protein AB8B82_12140 [Roseovarius sp.]